MRTKRPRALKFHSRLAILESDPLARSYESRRRVRPNGIRSNVLMSSNTIADASARSRRSTTTYDYRKRMGAWGQNGVRTMGTIVGTTQRYVNFDRKDDGDDDDDDQRT